MSPIFGYPENQNSGGSAPFDAEYVVMSLDSGLSNERKLTAGDGITITDGGAGGNVTISATATGSGNPAEPYVTWQATSVLTNDRVITAGNNVTIDTSVAGQVIINAAATGGGAPTTASFVTVGTESSLSAERVLTAGNGITITDNGANSTIDVGVASTITGASYLSVNNETILTGERKFQAQGGLVQYDNGANSTFIVTASALQTDITSLQGVPYVTIGNSSVTSAERALAVTSPGLSLTDGGANSSVTLANTASAFNTVAVSGQSNIVADALHDTLTVAAGTGISITTDANTDTLTITNSSPNVSQNLFETIAVAGQSNIVADSTTDTLTIASGDGIQITTNAGTDTLTIAASSLASNACSYVTVGAEPFLQNERRLVAGTNVTIDDSGPGGTITINAQATGGGGGGAPTNAQYVTLATNSTLTDERVATAGTGISLTDAGAGSTVTIANTASAFGIVHVTGQTDIYADALIDTLNVEAGTGISLTTNADTDTLTITNSAPNVDQNVFTKIAVSGQSDIDADSTTDTLTVASGTGISLTTNAGTDTLTIATTGLAANSEPFITVGNTSGLSAERALTMSNNMFSTDNGANSSFLLQSLPASSITGNATVDVNTKTDIFADATSGAISLLLPIASTVPEKVVLVKKLDSSGNAVTLNISGSDTIDGSSSFAISSQNNWVRVQSDSSTSTGWKIINRSYPTGFFAPNDPQYVTLATNSTLANERVLTAGTAISVVDGGAGSTVTINNTAQNFGTVAVSGQSDVVADATSDTLTLAAGTGISITTNAGTDTVTITNSSPNANQNLFETIAVAGQNSIVADSATDTLTVASGDGIVITTNDSTDTLTIAASALASNAPSYVTIGAEPFLQNERRLTAGTGISVTDAGAGSTVTVANTAQNFGTIAVSGQSDVVADALSDTLTFVAGTNMTITTSAGSDSVTFTAAGGGGFTYSAKSSNFTASLSNAYGVSLNDGNVVATLPDPGTTGSEMLFKIVAGSGGNTLSFAPASYTIDGVQATGVSSSIVWDNFRMMAIGASAYILSG